MYYVLKIYKINSPLYYRPDITYSASVAVWRSPGTDIRKPDPAGRMEPTTLCVAYDGHIDPVQGWTEMASCKQNVVGISV
jgi:hypothetical protein